jgi:hypothetical protein
LEIFCGCTFVKLDVFFSNLSRGDAIYGTLVSVARKNDGARQIEADGDNLFIVLISFVDPNVCWGIPDPDQLP